MTITPINIRQVQHLHTELLKSLASAKAEQTRLVHAVAHAQDLLERADDLVLRLQAAVGRLTIDGDAF